VAHRERDLVTRSLWWLLTGCRPDPPLLVSCAVQPDNALRVDCAVALEEPGPVELVYAPADGGEERTVSSGESLDRHVLTAWRMRPDTPYRYVARALSTGETFEGAWTTHPLPPEASVLAVPSAPTTATDDVLFVLSCARGYAFAVDAEGQPVWYQDLGEGRPGNHVARAVSVDDQGEISALIDQSLLRRFSPQGELLFEVDTEELGLEGALHHDLFRKDDLLYVLFAAVRDFGGQRYVLDGLYVLDAETGAHLATWELSDVVVPEGQHGSSGYWDLRFPNADDWSHGNGLFVDDALGVWTTWYQLDAVTRIDGDPASPTFGSLQLAVAGDTRSPWPALPVTDPRGLTDDDTFSRPHHPLLLSPGRLSLFDNEQESPSRVLELQLDEPAGTAEVTGSWDVGASCPVEGAAFPLSNGNWLATCPAEHHLVEIDAETAELVRTLPISCGPLTEGFLPKGIPVRW
jgi:hypothetical protein